MDKTTSDKYELLMTDSKFAFAKNKFRQLTKNIVSAILREITF